MHRVVAALFLIIPLAGCLDANDAYYGFDFEPEYRNVGVFPGDYRLGNGYSLVLEGGDYVASNPEIVRLTSDRPAFGPAAPAFGDDANVDIVMAIWRPTQIIDNRYVPIDGPTPIIVDAGPYYEIGAHCVTPNQDPCTSGFVDDTIDYIQQSTEFSIRNFLPHGYAVVQLAVRGTGTAGGCMDLLGPDEQHDLDQAITWLGTQDWSNGNIAMMGASYDGSTPWMVAATGNPHLKTIVPTSGLPDLYGLMFHNGSVETRGPFMHNQVYYGFGYDDQFPQAPGQWPAEVPWPVPPAGIGLANGREPHQDNQHLLCPEIVEASVLGAASTGVGSRFGTASTYWTERDYRQRVIDNYDGSIFIVHGLQDWNVDPHAVIPYNQELRAAGFEMKEWYGQWDHAFADSRCPITPPDWVVAPCRNDYAEVLLRWFDHYLKGVEGQELGPSVQVQDNIGFWRNVEAYPPPVGWEDHRLSADGVLDGTQSGEVDMMPPINGAPSELIEVRSAPLDEEIHISGLPQLRLPFSVTGQGGQIAAWLFDEDPRGLVRAPFAINIERFNQSEYIPVGTPLVGHAQMDLRHHAGGDEPQPLVPGQRYVAQIQFEPLDVRIPEGHRLVLWVFQYHYPDRTDSTTLSPVTVHLDEEAVLRLPVQDVDPRTVFPVPGAHFLNRTYVSEMYVVYPELPTATASQETVVCLTCRGAP